MATYPTENTTSTIVANMKAAGAPTPWPKPTTIGVLNSMAEIGADPVTVRNRTPPSPIAPLRSLATSGALRDVEVLDGWPHGQAGNFGILGLSHGTPPAHLRGA